MTIRWSVLSCSHPHSQAPDLVQKVDWQIFQLKNLVDQVWASLDRAVPRIDAYVTLCPTSIISSPCTNIPMMIQNPTLCPRQSCRRKILYLLYPGWRGLTLNRLNRERFDRVGEVFQEKFKTDLNFRRKKKTDCPQRLYQQIITIICDSAIITAILKIDESRICK